MSLIRVLPREVANRIAAGEVVERPASVVKELIENALDAGARHLQLDLKEGGAGLIRLVDDGEGMSPEDLALSVTAHATSKISSVEDLFRVASFGFRGEALPSIAAVSTLDITSRRREEKLGARLEARGDGVFHCLPCGAPPGTTVEVRGLFHNLPARRKFLKRERTELSHCLEAATRLLLPEPEVALRVTHNGRLVQEVASAATLLDRLRTFFGKGLLAHLVEARGGEGEARLRAFFSRPSLVKASTRYQYLFLNGRFIRDRGILAAIHQAYRGLIMPRDHPVVFLFLDWDPALVDVNVHPSKTEVRFRHPQRLFSLVRETLQRGLMSHEGTSPLRLSSQKGSRSSGCGPPASRAFRLEAELFPDGLDQRHAERVAESAAASGDMVCGAASPSGHQQPLQKHPPSRFSCGTEALPLLEQETGRSMQLHRSYILVEGPDGLVILDQHALHERKLYEELLARSLGGEGAMQHLLVPDVVDLGCEELSLILEHAPELEHMGVAVEPFGGNSLCVRALPPALKSLAGAQVVEEILQALHAPGSRLAWQELQKPILAGLACRAAVKFRDALPEAQIRELLHWWRTHPEARNCPHGRPVALSLSLRELQYQFQRKR